MTERLAQFRNNLLWPFSIVAGLLLHLVLISFLWHICTSCDDMQPPVLRLISLSKAVIPPPLEEVFPPVVQTVVEPAPVVEPETIIEPEPVIEPVIEPEPVIEQKTVEPEPVIEPEPVVEPVKLQTLKPQPRVKKPRPTVKPVAKAPKTESQPQPITQPIVATPVPVSRPAVSKPVVAPKPAAPAAVPVPAQDFSGYLQKIYRQLERGKKYPDRARRRGITGKVTVAFSISEEGRAVGAKVVGKAPRELADAALKLVASQKFASPPEGWNSTSRIEMQINYTLR